MAHRPAVIVFDVNETVSDMSPMAGRFADVGAPEHLLPTWFAMLLRDGFAVTVTARKPRFAELGEGTLRTVLSGIRLDRTLDQAVEHIMSGFPQLPVHADIPPGVRALRKAGLRLVTMTNGSVEITEAILDRAGIRGEFEALMSVEDAEAWKPAVAAYDHAVRSCGVDVGEAMLVAVHPWDIDGAARAGLQTAWINRAGDPYPGYFTKPDHTVSALPELAELLG